MDKATEIGQRRELLVDSHLIERMDGVGFRLHTPQLQPVSAAPLPPGGYMTVIRDGAAYRAYYRGRMPGYEGPNRSGNPGEITCLAESRDGVDWVLPELGLFELNGSRRNNVILAERPPFSHNFSPLLDARPGVAPEERYKALAGHPGGGRDRKHQADGLHAFVSADGLRWRQLDGGPVIPFLPGWSHAFDSQNVAFWSEAESCYVSYFRTWYRPTEAAGHGDAGSDEAGSAGSLRSISRATSPDFLHWSEPVAMDPNLPGEHLYTSQTHPYFRAPHIYVALPSRYVAGRVGAAPVKAMLGSTDILFMSTRAGSARFDRCFTEAFIRPGLQPERWENRGNYVALNVVPTGPAEMSIYHSKSGRRHTLRTDGFMSAQAGARMGELVTRPLIFTGDGLDVNYSTSAAGCLRIDILDADGKVLDGSGSEELVGDAIDHPVPWAAAQAPGRWAGQPVRLRFRMAECDLYSFRFTSGANHE